MDPDSPQADELRQLLNVVSGRAPDAQGRTSEPLVKEELAIVEFLTAKTNATSKPSTSAQNHSTDRPSRTEDQTPVDLLLGLAKTRSGRRAAEEEKRQSRLQQDREVEEQGAAARRNNGMGSPWGYVAPQIPGLDVQQPFELSGQRRSPRPLQPPPRKSDGTTATWSPDIFNSLKQMRAPQFLSRSPSQPTLPSPHRDSLASYPAPPQMSPFAGTSTLPLPSPSQTMDNSGPGEMLFNTQDGTHQFGQANVDSFDFSDLGLGTRLQSTPTEGGSFNPFALAQTAEEG